MRANSFDFDKLSISKKAEIVLSEGIYVSQSKFYQLEISLYRIGDQFIEMWYDTFVGQIINIQPMEGRAINPYLKHIEILNMN